MGTENSKFRGNQLKPSTLIGTPQNLWMENPESLIRPNQLRLLSFSDDEDFAPKQAVLVL